MQEWRLTARPMAHGQLTISTDSAYVRAATTEAEFELLRTKRPTRIHTTNEINCSGEAQQQLRSAGGPR